VSSFLIFFFLRFLVSWFFRGSLGFCSGDFS
jgi:hypothetical protein